MEGIIGTPQLTDSIVLPDNVEYLGQKIDLTLFKGLITSVQDTASSVVKTISSQPPSKFVGQLHIVNRDYINYINITHHVR